MFGRIPFLPQFSVLHPHIFSPPSSFRKNATLRTASSTTKMNTEIYQQLLYYIIL